MILLASCYLLTQSMAAQVTIGSNEKPQSYSVLELISSGKGGLRMPHFTTTERNNLNLGSLTGDTATKAVGLFIYNTTKKQLEYWDGTKWVGTSGEPTEPWFVSDSAKQATSNLQDIYQMGSVAIGYDGKADPTAILNVQSANKGVLLPRVTLKSSTDKTTIVNPTTGLLVYNTGNNVNFSTVGYMFWDGDQWRIFANASAESASATLNCSGTSMSPSQQVVGGTPIISGTVLQIPYSGSNGGSFNGTTLTSVGNPDVKATISGGMLSVGNGMLNFSLSGTPTIDQQAPNGITFDLANFLSSNTGITGCNEVTVGNVLTASIEETSVMGYLMYTTDNTGNDVGTTGYTLQCNSPDGKFSARVRVPSGVSSIAIGNQYINIQIRNNQDAAQTVIWNYNTIYSGGTVAGANTLTIPAKRWGGNNSDSGSTWYNATAYNTAYGGYMGNIGIYDGSGPEYRRYTWIPLGANNKVSYEILVMAALDTPTPGTAVSPEKLKVFIKFTQVTAQ